MTKLVCKEGGQFLEHVHNQHPCSRSEVYINSIICIIHRKYYVPKWGSPDDDDDVMALEAPDRLTDNM